MSNDNIRDRIFRIIEHKITSTLDPGVQTTLLVEELTEGVMREVEGAERMMGNDGRQWAERQATDFILGKSRIMTDMGKEQLVRLRDLLVIAIEQGRRHERDLSDDKEDAIRWYLTYCEAQHDVNKLYNTAFTPQARLKLSERREDAREALEQFHKRMEKVAAGVARAKGGSDEQR